MRVTFQRQYSSGGLAMNRQIWCLGLVVAACAAHPGAAGEQPQPVDPQKVMREAEEVAEELMISRIYSRLGVNSQQAARLAPVLEQVQAKLKEVDDREALAVARLRAAAEDARKRALAGGSPQTAV